MTTSTSRRTTAAVLFTTYFSGDIGESAGQVNGLQAPQFAHARQVRLQPEVGRHRRHRVHRHASVQRVLLLYIMRVYLLMSTQSIRRYLQSERKKNIGLVRSIVVIFFMLLQHFSSIFNESWHDILAFLFQKCILCSYHFQHVQR